jgi:hypothetical protein
VGSFAQDSAQLRDVQLACVVKSRPEVIAANLPEGSLPFTLICDAEGVLYDYFCIPTTKSRLKAYSVQTVKIINEAKKQGYQPPKDEELSCPLTLLVGPEGRVLFSHYGQTLTDLPENCSAIRNFSRDVIAQAREKGLLPPAQTLFQGKLSALQSPDLAPEKQQEIKKAMNLLYGDGEDEDHWDDWYANEDPRSIYMYDFSNASLKALTLAGIDNVDQIKAMTDAQLAAIPGMTEKDLSRIRTVLSYDDDE